MTTVSPVPARSFRDASEAPPRRLAQAMLASLCAAVLALSIAAALVTLVAHPEQVDSLLFVGAFIVLLPLCLLLTLFLAGAERVAPGLSVVAVLIPAALVGLLIVSRALDQAGHRDQAPALLLAGSVALLTVGALSLWRPWSFLRQAAQWLLTRPWWLLAGASAILVWAAALLFAPAARVTALNIVLALLIAVAIGAAYLRLRLGSGGRLVLVADVVVVLLILTISVDLTIYQPATSPGFGLSDPTAVGLATRQYQQDPYLGAVNDVLHGRALLVDTSSQYGVGDIYLLAAIFKIVPIGYGPFGLIATLFTGIEFALAFLIMRVASSRWTLALAAAAAAVAIGAVSLFTTYFPSLGGLRYSPPLLLLLLALYGIRRADNGTPVTVGTLIALAVAAVWSIETFVFTLFVYLGVAVFYFAARENSPRSALRAVGRSAAIGAGVCLSSYALLSLLTRLLAGAWPDWGWYVEYLTAYSTGPAEVPIGLWSPVWLIAGVYFASLGAAIALAALRRPFVQRNLLSMTAIVGASVCGLAFLVYFVNRSLDSLLPPLALPAFVVVCIWLDLFLGGRRRAAGAAAVLAVAWLGAFLTIAAWPVIKGSFRGSALGHAVPGGRSLTGDFSFIWDSPPIDPRSVEAQWLMDRYFKPGDALLLLEPDLGIEALMRDRRANTLPIGFPAGHGIRPSSWLVRLRSDVAELKPGTLVLLLRHPPSPNGEPAEPAGPLYAERVFGQVNASRWLSPPAEMALREVRRHFAFEPVVKGRYGLLVAKLVPRHGVRE